MERLAWLGVTFLLAGCGSTAYGSMTLALEPAMAACAEAMAAAAAVGPNAATVADLYPAVRACKTVDLWTAAFDANGGVAFGGSAREVLVSVCTAPVVAEEQLCAQVD